MTDEEMAEEYFKSVCKDYNEEKERTGERHYWVGFDLKYAFLAGLKAGRPKWHKVADGDLPKENHFVLIFNKQTGYEIARHAPFEEYRHDNWVTVDNRSLIPIKNKSPVIAWCEIPKYTEE